MAITIINDCRDANAIGRQITRLSALTNQAVSFVGVHNDLEAAGNLIDVVDAFGDNPGMILVNVAPRNGPGKKWENGTPFGYFRYNKILILASIDGYTLSLAKKYELTKTITVLEASDTWDKLIADGLLPIELKDAMIRTQFRSYDFLPRVAAYLDRHHDLPGTELQMSDVPDAPAVVWWVDCFGNCKTTVWHDEAATLNDLPYHPRLKDVPDKTAAVVLGSSGISKKRFLEIVVQGGSAAQTFNLASGSPLQKAV
ncbi:MAG: hypothetical protein WCV88_05340 [Patescibacteria group bacterium]|jgi:hypothetical protein